MVFDVQTRIKTYLEAKRSLMSGITTEPKKNTKLNFANLKTAESKENDMMKCDKDGGIVQDSNRDIRHDKHGYNSIKLWTSLLNLSISC
jgi:hypothetical protein